METFNHFVESREKAKQRETYIKEERIDTTYKTKTSEKEEEKRREENNKRR